MSKCLNVDGACGLNNVTDGRCCFYCEFKSSCSGICITLESEGDYEDIAKVCFDFEE